MSVKGVFGIRYDVDKNHGLPARMLCTLCCNASIWLWSLPITFMVDCCVCAALDCSPTIAASLRNVPSRNARRAYRSWSKLQSAPGRLSSEDKVTNCRSACATTLASGPLFSCFAASCCRSNASCCKNNAWSMPSTARSISGPALRARIASMMPSDFSPNLGTIWPLSTSSRKGRTSLRTVSRRSANAAGCAPVPASTSVTSFPGVVARPAVTAQSATATAALRRAAIPSALRRLRL
mmetsp:Transcript_1274/g.3046  ORF Transcript_1274/g.3046 Transcript_1274/m.3046 type:complete len:237 (+) Transcript_1274:263-973(+)